MLERRLALDLHELRGAGAAMLAAGAVLPLLPGHPGIACPLRRATGVPCPLCGMTTSVEATLRLHVHAALAANPAGAAAVLVALALLVVRPRRLHVPFAVLPAALAAMWLFELHRYSFL
ncbi:MAG TPA: DUF2752 domain-containing protein [Gaiellaceae bacterium]|nr:DUF2752 domain-containing protein [Gaiellaceae bacterium]